MLPNAFAYIHINGPKSLLLFASFTRTLGLIGLSMKDDPRASASESLGSVPTSPCRSATDQVGRHRISEGEDIRKISQVEVMHLHQAWINAITR